MTTATARVYEYRGHTIEVNAFNMGRWGAEVVICGPLTDSKPQLEIIRSHVSAELAERAAREWARRRIDRLS
jgi:hypothetical protein